MSKQPWALISRRLERLRESVVLELARTGMNIFGLHVERHDRGPHAEQLQEKIQALGRESEFFQGDATDDAMRQRVIERMGLTLAKPPQGHCGCCCTRFKRSRCRRSRERNKWRAANR